LWLQISYWDKLRQDGMEIPDEVLTGFSPYWCDHLNRFGVFTLDMAMAALACRQPKPPPEYSAPPSASMARIGRAIPVIFNHEL